MPNVEEMKHIKTNFEARKHDELMKFLRRIAMALEDVVTELRVTNSQLDRIADRRR